MDNITHEVRIMNWKSVIEQCHARPSGQTQNNGWMKIIFPKNPTVTSGDKSAGRLILFPMPPRQKTRLWQQRFPLLKSHSRSGTTGLKAFARMQ